MKTPDMMAASPIRRQAVDTFRRARRLPPGSHRDDLRQLAFGLLKLHKRGIKANTKVILATTT
jgi:hypothetical protein